MIDGSVLRELRIAAGRTQAEVAAAVGIPATVLSAYERGRRQPGVEVASRIVDAVGYRIRLVPKPDPMRQGRLLAEVLGLAEALPFAPRPMGHARR
jgi:transcriptional regulator with XRE-family HTH domain